MQLDPTQDTLLRQAHFALRPEDMVAAYRRFQIARLRTRRILIACAFTLLVAAGLIIFARPLEFWFPIAMFLVFGTLFGIIFGILCPLASIRWYVPTFARRVFHQQRRLSHETQMEWDDSQVRFSTVDVANRADWADYMRWDEDRDIILLYNSEAMFQMLPKRVLSPNQVEDLRAIAAIAKIPGAASKR